MIGPKRRQVDDVHGRYPSLEKRHMIVLNRVSTAAERACITEFSSTTENKSLQPRSRTRLAQDIELPVADHVDKNQSPELLQPAVSGQLFHHVPAAIEAVGWRPLAERLLPIEIHQPV